MSVEDQTFRPKTSSNENFLPVRLLHTIRDKYKPGMKLNKQELIFLYEIESTFHVPEYYELERNRPPHKNYNPRFDDQSIDMRRELINTIVYSRKNEAPEDQLVIFDCKKEQVAHSVDEIKENTKAYIGEWSPEISKKIPENIKYLYESFPDKRIFRRKLELKPKTGKEYYFEILEGEAHQTKRLVHPYPGAESTGIEITDQANYFVNQLQALEQKEEVSLLAFSIEQLGFTNEATTQEIFDKIEKFGFKKCPQQVAPQLRIDYKNQPYNEELIVLTEPLGDNELYLFNIGSDVLGNESLSVKLADPKRMWSKSVKFLVIS